MSRRNEPPIPDEARKAAEAVVAGHADAEQLLAEARAAGSDSSTIARAVRAEDMRRLQQGT